MWHTSGLGGVKVKQEASTLSSCMSARQSKREMFDNRAYVIKRNHRHHMQENVANWIDLK